MGQALLAVQVGGQIIRRGRGQRAPMDRYKVLN
jgi:hypothetical protein